jgi:competence protein ComEA
MAPAATGTTPNVNEYLEPKKEEKIMIKRTLLTLALATALAGEAFAAAPAITQVNINTATVQQLQLLPRVGPALAKRIVDFRTANGEFKSAQELTRVKGVGEKTLALLQPYLAVKGDTTLAEKVHAGKSSKAGPVKAAE